MGDGTVRVSHADISARKTNETVLVSRASSGGPLRRGDSWDRHTGTDPDVIGGVSAPKQDKTRPSRSKSVHVQKNWTRYANPHWAQIETLRMVLFFIFAMCTIIVNNVQVVEKTCQYYQIIAKYLSFVMCDDFLNAVQCYYCD